jgi:hypothetical protein
METALPVDPSLLQNRFFIAAAASFPSGPPLLRAKAPRDIAYCLSQLSVGERGLRRLAEAWKLYEGALHDPSVEQSLKLAAQRAAKKAAAAPKAGAGKQDAALLPLLAHLRLQQAYYRGQRTTLGDVDAEGGPADDELAYAGAVDVHALAAQHAAAGPRYQTKLDPARLRRSQPRDLLRLPAPPSQAVRRRHVTRPGQLRARQALALSQLEP